MLFQCNQMLFQEFYASYKNLMKRDREEFLILKKGLHHFLTTLKHFNTEKGYHRCLKVFNTENGLYYFLRTLKVFKGLHHFLDTLKGLNFGK